MLKDALGERLKHNYEEVSKTRLTRRMPVMIRIDGKAFHTFTKGMVKPFDNILVETMQETMKYLCENIQGCVLGYTQSDEITLVLVDYQKLTSDAWFDYEVQKICSISASLATLAFNRIFKEKASAWIDEQVNDKNRFHQSQEKFLEINKLIGVYEKAIEKGAFFDSRCFNIPKEEVNNFVLWRQLDAEKNSVSSVAQANFSHKELQGLSTKERITKLEEEKGIIWGDLPTTLKRGSCCIKEFKYLAEDGHELIPVRDIADNLIEFNYNTANGSSSYPQQKVTIRSKWVIDNNIPRFSENTEYVNLLINVGE